MKQFCTYLITGLILTTSIHATPVILNYTPRGYSEYRKQKTKPNPVEQMSRFRQLDHLIKDSNPAQTDAMDYAMWASEAVGIKKQLRGNTELVP